MVRKKVYVVLSKDNAKVVTNPAAPPIGGVLVDPNDLPKNTAPHYWKLDAGKVVAMTKEEKGKVMVNMPSEMPMINMPSEIPTAKSMKINEKQTLSKLLYLILGGLIGASVWQLFKY